MSKSIQEQIAENDRRMNQLKERNRQLRRRQSEKDRKARTKSLIEIGARVEQATHLKWATREDWDRFTRIMQYGIRLSDGTEHTIGDIIRITDERLTAPAPAEPVPAPTSIDMPQFPSPRFTSSQPAYLQD